MACSGGGGAGSRYAFPSPMGCALRANGSCDLQRRNAAAAHHERTRRRGEARAGSGRLDAGSRPAVPYFATPIFWSALARKQLALLDELVAITVEFTSRPL